MTTSPTISIGVWEDRIYKLNELMEIYRRENRPISRTEIFWYAIDALHELKCPVQKTEGRSEVQQEAA